MSPPPNILVLFQNPRDRHLIRSFLLEKGFGCHLIDNSEDLEALLACEQLSQYSLVMLDIHVAHGFGQRLLKKTSTLKSHLPIILALPADAARRHWWRAGFNEIIELPVPKEELLVRLQANIVKSGRTEAHLEAMNEKLREQNKQLRRANHEAEAGLNAKFQFLANMSHELRTPLHGINLCVHNLKETTVKDDRDASEQLEMIEISVESLLGLVDSILDMTRFESSQFQIKPRPFHFRKHLTALASPIERKALSKKLDFEMEVSSSIPEMVESDPVRLGQIISNLLTNAVKFTDAGTISATFDWSDGVLEFSIKDTGRGISPDHLDAVFERFYQVDDTHSRRSDGAGLGLFIVTQLVELLGGELQVDSELTKGTCFQARIPMKGASQQKEDEDRKELSESNLSILVVEDNPVSLKALTVMLEQRGHRVTSIMDPTEVLQLPNLDFDVAVVDVQMPELTGIELTELIREREAKRHSKRLPILALTAAVSERDRNACLESGMDEYMAKPPKPSELFSCLARLAKGS